MEGVVVQRVDNIHDPVRRIHADRRTVDRIWHCSIESPIPVGHPEGGSRGLVLASLGCWVCCGDLLCVVPEGLLFRVSYSDER